MTAPRPTPLAYLLTWSCAGTWLHGDTRGWMDRVRNSPGAPWPQPDADVRQLTSVQPHAIPVTLSDAMRAVVERAITDHCALREWRLHALNARSTHVHVVVTSSESPEEVFRQFKSWSTRRLRAAGLVGPTQRLWTRHGSTRYLWDPKSIADAVHYVMEYQ